MTRALGLTISELAQLHGVSLRTLRFYEERKLLTPRRIGQSRYYCERDEARLKVILQGKRMGFTLSEIARILAKKDSTCERSTQPTAVLTSSQIEAQIAVLVQRRGEAEAAIRELRGALIDDRLKVPA